ncbi:MAG: ABC transporter permease [Candidatus Omnitrophica bacterium]|nr:ABC transporter permease [Candidatus Omnitrophota bacterium]
MKKEIYESHKFLKLGVKIWPSMFSELGACRDLIWRLFVRDVTAKYKQSFLGIFWAIITPLFAIATFSFLNRSGILNIGHVDVPYILYALIGLSIFQIFSTGIVAGCGSLVSAADMITKINFPRESLVIASMAQALTEFIIKFFMILILFVIYKFVPKWEIIFLPIVLVPMVFLTLGLSFVLSLINGIFRDTAQLVTILSSFLLFLTPVLYPIPSDHVFLFKVNPLVALVNAPRDLMIYGLIREPLDYAVASGVSVLFFLISWRLFHLIETKIPERV